MMSMHIFLLKQVKNAGYIAQKVEKYISQKQFLNKQAD